MKKAMTIIATCGLFLVMAVASSSAQTVMKADIPFDFVAGSHSMPAGTYIVTTHDNGAISLSGPEKAFVLSNRLPENDENQKARLLFKRSGETYALSQIWIREYGRQVPVNRKLVKLAVNGKATIVAVLLQPVR